MMTRFSNKRFLSRLAHLLAGATLIFTAGTAGAVEINPELERMEKGFETRIQENLQTFLGEEAKIIASVHIREAVPASSLKGGPSGTDFIYAPTPVLNFSDADSKKHLLIRSIDVDLQIGGEVEDAALASAKELVQKTLKGMNAKVTVARLNIPVHRSVAGTQTQPTGLGHLSPELKSLLPIIGIVLAALIITLGILFIAQSMKSSAETVVQGISRIVAPSRSPDGINIELTEPKVSAPQKDPTFNPVAIKEYQRNLAIIKDTLTQNPMVFLRTIENTENDLRGIKWLLPSLSTEEQQTLRTYIGKAALDRLVQIDRISVNSDQMPWLQDFVERLAIRKLNEKTLVEKAIGPEKSSRLYLSESQFLIQAIRKMNTPASWRILSEFLPKDQLDKVIDEMQQNEWSPLFQAGQLDAGTLGAAADEILAAVEKAPSEKTLSDERTSFYSKTLLDPILRSLEKKDIGQEESFLAQVGAQAPELVAMVRERFWTADYIPRIPEDILTPLIRDMRNETRLALLLALPEATATRLQNLLPKGNVRTIITDQLAHARSRKDHSELKNASRVARQFIENLRKLHAEGRYQLLPSRDKPELRIAA